MISIIAPPAYDDLESGPSCSNNDSSAQSQINQNDQQPPDYQEIAELSVDELRVAYERREYQLATLRRIHNEERRRVEQDVELARQQYINAVSSGTDDDLSLSGSTITIIEATPHSQRLRRTHPSHSVGE
ncbi:unnamed protein product, partial [Mesorhabditis belari]|uniref:Uncharacterized protein n=1 Tax=Mesorhabditis belari TaxID=2138241 RepID=A0AAF3FN29_9BILA